MIADRYEPISAIGAGGMGEVIFCQDRHLQRKVAVKHLQPGIDTRRLLDEQKTLAKIRSKHVVQLYDIVSIDFYGTSRPAIVLEFIDGADLEPATFVADAKFLKVIWQIACGLSDIHANGVIHRDIKPNNIKIDSEGVVKIFDFGLARTSADAQTVSIIGTPIFMAPELWGTAEISFDAAVDVYAFGITCIALLGGNPPASLMARPPVQPPWADLCAVMHAVPENIARMIYACINTNAADRPSIENVRDLLARELLKGRHRATVVLNNTVHTLDASSRRITLDATVGRVVIEYDGLDFKVAAHIGLVYINNSIVRDGSVVPGCCVLTFGDGSARKFVTFDISHPEVMA